MLRTLSHASSPRFNPTTLFSGEGTSINSRSYQRTAGRAKTRMRLPEVLACGRKAANGALRLLRTPRESGKANTRRKERTDDAGYHAAYDTCRREALEAHFLRSREAHLRKLSAHDPKSSERGPRHPLPIVRPIRPPASCCGPPATSRHPASAKCRGIATHLGGADGLHR